MYPTLNTGDKVLVDTSKKDITDGKIYILRIENDLKIKRLHKLSRGRVEVISDNKNYSADILDPERDDFEICGKVLWSIVCLI
jgi:phage repressor protein C with HTH and peptisase S24 domain